MEKKKSFGIYTSFILVYCLTVVPVRGESPEDHVETEPVLEAPQLVQPPRQISLTGLKLSAVVPGSGQLYTGHYLKGGMFLALEAVAGGTALFWGLEATRRGREVERFRDSLEVYRTLAQGLQGEALEPIQYRAGLYSVLSDRALYEVRQARVASYNSLAWMIGGYVFNVMDAVGESGILSRSGPRDPGKAGWLTAIPGLGLGQLYNGAPGKAGMVAMTQFSLGIIAYNNHRLMADASTKYNQMRDSTQAQYPYRTQNLGYWKGRYDQAFSERNTYLWYSVFFYLYSIFDAVVDAHLSDYPEKMRLQPDFSVGAHEAAFSITYKL